MSNKFDDFFLFEDLEVQLDEEDYFEEGIMSAVSTNVFSPLSRRMPEKRANVKKFVEIAAAAKVKKLNAKAKVFEFVKPSEKLTAKEVSHVENVMMSGSQGGSYKLYLDATKEGTVGIFTRNGIAFEAVLFAKTKHYGTNKTGLFKNTIQCVNIGLLVNNRKTKL